MTIRHLRIFLSVCKNGFNTTKAAEDLHLSQPAVSLAIKELEDYYGVRLFDRIGRRLSITDAGRRFLDYASHIISLFDDLERSMQNWDSFGLLRIGASITIGSQFLPGYVKAFNTRCPGIDLRVLVTTSDELEEKLLSNELDLALIEGVSHEGSLISEEYMEDSLTVICPPDIGFRQGQVISVEEFKAQKFLLREPGSGTREIFDRTVEQAGFSVTPIWEAMSTTALINAVTSGIGISVIPRRMAVAALRRGDVISISVDGLSFKRKFHIVYHKEKFLTPSAKAFIELCRNYELDYPLPDYR
ncbi:MAG TPA: LysR family transcriptional regulator [Candidatus Avilachnospira avistercoris]|nr:LysR family transcriptional regulator [Candidatus Avilachnospira avistercoris]